jgi:thymidylate synthase
MNQLDIQYQNLLFEILETGIKKEDRTGTGTLSLFGRQIRHKMKDGFPLLTTKKMYWKGIVTELLWFLRGDTNIKFLVDNGCHIWDGDAYKQFHQAFPEAEMLSKEQFIEKIKTDAAFSKRFGELGPIYGKQWRSWGEEKQMDLDTSTVLRVENGIEKHPYKEFISKQGIDQIANSINLLKTDPDSRRNRVNAWNVGELDQMVLPPCHTDFQFFTRELSLEERVEIYGVEKIQTNNAGWYECSLAELDVNQANIPKRAISLMWNQRSVDTFLGLPFNIASYGLLLEIIAKEVNMVPDELIGNLGDVHLYEDHMSQARQQITREPFPLPSLDIHPGILDYDMEKYPIGLFEIKDYQSHPTIKAPLSN